MFIQATIFILSAAAIWLISRHNSWSRWGHVVGLSAQPFWLYTSYVNEQWGLVALTLFYTYCWITGIRNNFNLKF